MGEKIELNIVGLTSGHSQRNSYTLILGEENGELKLPIVIGSYEAQSIALVIEGLTPQRPLTHDLMFDTFTNYSIELKEVIIDQLKEGVFYAKLVTEQNGEQHVIDSRTSDAIAMALRAKCPIYTYKTIMDNAGIIYDADDEADMDDAERSKQTFEPKQKEVNSLNSLSLVDLNKELDKAIQIEDYDRAAMLRDEIKKRS
ncbi:MAG: bifunctional nuclease domain-containing protein [Bacteroidia bacterium]|jgi:bifunctional DNase/RNase|tara:strand:+ start:840 stop:1439 length:600 start_codon:yes stop_codon:yes gene_type:complete